MKRNFQLVRVAWFTTLAVIIGGLTQLPSFVEGFALSGPATPPKIRETTASIRHTAILSATQQDDTPAAAAAATSSSSSSTKYDIDSAIALLTRAANTKSEDSDTVVEALLDLEKLMRRQVKQDPTLAERTLQALSNSSNSGPTRWRLIFTTGTINTQEKRGRINYFPIKAVQSFNSNTAEPSSSWEIANGIYLGETFCLVNFQGDFDWTIQPPKSGVTKLTFDFTKVTLFGFLEFQLKSGEAASIGASTGLGSKSNVNLVEKQGKRAFFNWISADENIATARGGGGGLALWKRIDE